MILFKQDIKTALLLFVYSGIWGFRGS